MVRAQASAASLSAVLEVLSRFVTAALQPAMRLLPVDLSLGPFQGAQRIQERGVYIGCHAKPLEEWQVQWLADSVLQVLRDHVR